jgi:molybdopterin/thiamine biosynthesis adenylyltransferase
MPGKFHHEAIYRGEALLKRLAELRIVICGVGALGSNLAETLVRQGVTRLRLIDHDRVEEHNIGTQTYAQADIGQPKADALRKHLFRIADVEAEAIRKELKADNARTLLKDVDLIVDAFDNSLSRRLVQDCARTAGVGALHAGLFADYGEIVWDEAYRVPNDVAGDVCDYPLARNLVVMTAAIAAEEIVGWTSGGTRRSWSITLRDLAVRPWST